MSGPPKSKEVVVRAVSWGHDRASIIKQMLSMSLDGTVPIEMDDGIFYQSREEILELAADWPFNLREGSDGRGKARNTLHLVLSAPVGTDRDTVWAATLAWVRETYGEPYRDQAGPRFEYVMTRRDDTENPHAHILISAYGTDGMRLRMAPKDFDVLRKRFAEKCREQGIDVTATQRSERSAS